MTLKEKLRARRKIAQAMKPLDSAKEIWKHISQEFDSLTGIELRLARIACIEVEVSDQNRLTLTKYIEDANHAEKKLPVTNLLLTADCAAKIEEVMKEVAEKAQQEECRVDFVKEENYLGWGFEIFLLSVKE